MHIVKFPWVKHTEDNRQYEIYSVSVSPDGSRLATGGLDGKVKIWSIDTFYKYQNVENFNNNVELDPNECRPLCSMSRHEGAITCVRFSNNNGQFLASGSDDKLILIWEKDEEKTKIMKMNRDRLNSNFSNLNSGFNDTDLEHWTLRKRLVAHDNDVQDMAWSPDNSILVTVGLDRSIVVWNGFTFEKIKKFDIHQSHVKGVVFDPAGKYFATCSDDRTLKIFRFSKNLNNEYDFSVEKIINEPFRKSPLTTYFRRCSWSPDGLYISAPNGTNEGINANVVIKRGSWESELSLIGHRLPCEVCSFSPRLYNINDDVSIINKRSETVIITAGQDRTLTLWSSRCSTPLCVATEISLKSITDIAWNLNGLNVYLCGLDGMVISIFFDESELGHVLPLQENNDALIRYGKDRDNFFPESVEQLTLEEYADKRGFFINNSLKQTDDRIKSLMSSGTPQGGLPLVNEKPITTMNILIPRSKKYPNKKMPVPKLSSINNQENTDNSKINVLNAKNQKFTITKSGKKRVTPLLISANSNSTPLSTNLTSISNDSKNPTTTKLISKRLESINKLLVLPNPAPPKTGIRTLVTSLRSNVLNENELGDEESAIDYIIETDQHQNLNQNNSTSNKRGRKYKNKQNNGTIRNDSLSSFNYINQQKRQKTIYPDWSSECIVSSSTIFGDRNVNDVVIEKKIDNEQIIEVRYENEISFKFNNNENSEFDNNEKNLKLNEFQENFNHISHLVAKEDNPVWELFINEKITCIGDSKLDNISYWCLSTENGRIYLFSSTGRQLCGSIELGSNILKIICNKDIIMCICSNGLIHSWKFTNINGQFIGKSIIESASLSSLTNTYTNYVKSKKKVEVNSSIKDIMCLNNGIPLVKIDADQRKFLFIFDINLDCWIEVFDSWYIKQLQKLDKSINVDTKSANRNGNANRNENRNNGNIEKIIETEISKFKFDKVLKILMNRIEKDIKTNNGNEIIDDDKNTKMDDTNESKEQQQRLIAEKDSIVTSWESANKTVIEAINKIT